MHRRLVDSIDLNQLMEHIRKLTEISPERLSGTEIEKQVVTYFRQYLGRFGVPLTVHELDGYVSFPGKSTLKVLSPMGKDIPCSTFAQIASTGEEGLQGELVYVGQGGQDVYQNLDVKGKIVLSELSYTPPRPEKVRLATLHGATGMIMMNWGLPEHESLPLGTVKSIWGNPTDEDFHRMPTIPVLGVTRRSGEELRDLCAQGPVKISMVARAQRRWETILLPRIVIPGSGKSDKFVIVAGHYDCWDAGVTCNAVGNSLKLEIARILWENQGSLLHDVWVCFWPAHETGIMEGSVWLVDNFWREIKDKAVAYVNIDSPGLKDASEFVVRASPELARFNDKMIKDHLDPKVPSRRLRLTRTGDQSFFGVGLPALYARHSPSPEEQKKWHGATLGWWYHSSEDTIDKVSEENYLLDSQMIMTYIVNLADSALLPLEFMDSALEFKNRLQQLQEQAKGSLDLSPEIALAEKYHQMAEKLDQAAADLTEAELAAGSAKLELINQCIMILSRIVTPVLSTVRGRYDHDTYGLSAQNEPLPGLFDAAVLGSLDPGQDAFKLMATRLVREKNRVSDALMEACRRIEETLVRI